MKDFLSKLTNSLDTTSSGFSGRKLTALASIIIAAYVTYQLPADAKLYALYSWQALALLCLGIVTFEQIVKLKNGNEPKD